MAKFDAQNSARGVHMQLDSLWAFDTQDAGVNDANNYSWLTSGGHDVQARGEGIAYSGGQPTNGHIYSLEFDFNNDGFLSPDVVVSHVDRYLPNMTVAPSSQFFTGILSGDDEVIGSDFDDFLYGYDGDDVMNGGAGKNRMDGGKGDDVITEGGQDTVFAGDDDDRVIVTSDVVGDDYWNGGAGNDWIDFSNLLNAGRVINLNDAKLKGSNAPGAAEESLIGFENVEGGSGDESIVGTNGTNILNGNDGDDSLHGKAGNDTLYGGAGADTMNGNQGDDTLVQDSADGPVIEDRMVGEGGHDRILLKGSTGDNQFDTLNDKANIVGVEEIEFNADGNNVDKTLSLWSGEVGGFRLSDTAHIDGNDAVGSTDKIEIHMGKRLGFNDTEVDISGWTFEGWGGQNELISIFGDDDAETMIGSSQEDAIFGNGGNDVIDAGAGDDTVSGGNGNDFLKGGDGADGLFGGSGIDVLRGGAGADQIDGGAGDKDWLDYRGSDDAVSLNLGSGFAAGGHAEGDTFEKVERAVGSSFNDRMTGDAGDNALRGEGGNDFLRGGGGNDVLQGGAGNDVIRGGAGADILDGGAGDKDWLDYRGTNAAVTVDLGAGTASRGHAEGDVFSNFERVAGSGSSDRLTGDAGVNALRGGGGNDILDGAGGNDVLQGEAGNDTFLFNAGSDILQGGSGDDLAIFLGERDDFGITGGANGNWTVTDLATGDIDTLTSVETLRFDDGDFVF